MTSPIELRSDNAAGVAPEILAAVPEDADAEVPVPKELLAAASRTGSERFEDEGEAVEVSAHRPFLLDDPDAWASLDQALGDRRGIRRYGFSLLPMDESLARAAVDLGGRPFLVYSIADPTPRIRDFNVKLIEEFFRAFVTQARMNLHIAHLYGAEVHHAYESVFKGLARALRMAVERDPRETGIPSSKGTI